MITRLIIGLLVLFSIGANAQLAKTLWINSDEGSKIFLKFEHELLTYGIDGVENSTTYMKYDVKGDTLYINSLSSDAICISEDEKHASYLISNTRSNILRLDAINDECIERLSLLNGKNWSPQNSNENEDLSYLVISIVKDEILVSGVRNPQKLYITDLDGNPLLSVKGENKIALSTLAKGEYILEVWDQNQLTWAKRFDRE